MNVNDKQMPIEYDNLLRDFQELRKEKDALYEEILEKERVICNKFCYECELERRIKELEANQSKWVSVKERMPLTIRPVLSSIYGSVMVDSWDGECWESNCHITHWMPLPNPPKETK